MLDDEYNLHKDGECEWTTSIISDSILQDLMALNCDAHGYDSNIFQQFFSQKLKLSQHQTSTWDECFVTSIAKDKDDEDSSIFANTDLEVEDTKENAAGTTEMFVDQITAGGELRSDMLDLLFLLDEQSATIEQLSAASDQHLDYVISKVSDRGLCHLCTLICTMSASDQSRFGSRVCRHLLVPRLQEQNREACNHIVVMALIEFTKSLPHLGCTEVLLPLMLSSDAINEKDTLLQIIKEALNLQYKETLLRNFLQGESDKLNEWQLPFIQELLSPSCGDDARYQLVQLLAASADSMTVNTRFAKLLVSVIQQLGPGAPPDIHQQLALLVSSNKSVLKRAAEKALRTL